MSAGYEITSVSVDSSAWVDVVVPAPGFDNLEVRNGAAASDLHVRKSALASTEMTVSAGVSKVIDQPFNHSTQLFRFIGGEIALQVRLVSSVATVTFVWS